MPIKKNRWGSISVLKWYPSIINKRKVVKNTKTLQVRTKPIFTTAWMLINSQIYRQSHSQIKRTKPVCSKIINQRGEKRGKRFSIGKKHSIPFPQLTISTKPHFMQQHCSNLLYFTVCTWTKTKRTWRHICVMKVSINS